MPAGGEFMNIFDFLSFMTASVLLTLAPGPDILYLLAKSLSSGTRAGITLAAGLCSGLIFHTSLVMFGVAALIRQSPSAFLMLKYTGVAYLSYLAWKSFRNRPPSQTSAGKDSLDRWPLYRRGLFMNITNPKVLFFFLAFLPQFVNFRSAAGAAVQIGLLGASFAAQAFLIFSLTALFAGQAGQHLIHHPGFQRTMDIVQGCVLLVIAGALFVFA